jgi:hypothetical protein
MRGSVDQQVMLKPLGSAMLNQVQSRVFQVIAIVRRV